MSSAAAALVDCSNSTGYVHKLNVFRASTAIAIWLLVVVPNAVLIVAITRSMLSSRQYSVPKCLVLALAVTDVSYGGRNRMYFFFFFFFFKFFFIIYCWNRMYYQTSEM